MRTDPHPAPGRRRRHPRGARAALPLRGALALLAALVFLPACFGGGAKPPPFVRAYTLDYPPPATAAHPLDAVLKVEGFSSARSLQTPAMRYDTTATESGEYNYHRWVVAPAFLAQDFLLRDLRTSGDWRAVYGPYDLNRARFQLQGAVTRFQEAASGETWAAQLTLVVTLLDRDRPLVPDRVMFQREYREEEPLDSRSARVLADVRQAVAARLASPSPPSHSGDSGSPAGPVAAPSAATPAAPRANAS